MGNIESTQRQYTAEQLQQLEKADIQILQILDSELFDDNFICQKYLHELESSTGQFALDDEKITKLKKGNEKWTNTEAALACISGDAALPFLQNELKWLKREIGTLIGLVPSGIETIVEIRLGYIYRIHTALIRRDLRQAAKKKYISREKILQQKADFIMNLFSGATDKIVDELLFRVTELPELGQLSYFDDTTKMEEDGATTSTSEASNSDNPDSDLTAEERQQIENMELEQLQPPQDKQLLEEQKTQDDMEEIKTQEMLENQAFEKSLLSLLLMTAVEESKQLLQQLKPDTPLPDQSKPVIASPSIRLLQMMQRHLLFQASCCTDANNKPTRTLLAYSNVVISQSVALVEWAFKVNAALISANNENTTATRLDFRVQYVLKNSILQHITYPLTTVLLLITSKPYLEDMCYELVSALIPLLHTMDSLNAFNNEFKQAEVNYLEKMRIMSQQDSQMEVESPHNYYPNTDEEKVIHIPGATHLSVTFDPRCNTDQGNDFLQLYKRPNKEEPVLTAFSGRAENWPRVPVIVPGNTVVFHFYTDPFATFWGYRCIVTAFCLEGSNVWLYDLQRSVGLLTRKCLRRSIGTKVTDSEKALETWLDSPLLRGGLQEPSETESKFVEDFINNTPATLANLVITETEKQVTPNPMIDKMGGNCVTVAVKSFIIALVKHLGLLPAVLGYDISNRSAELNEQLIKIFLEGRKLRQWIGAEKRERQLKQEAAKEAAINNNNITTTEPTEDTASYEYISSDILTKMKFLLSLAPACGSHPDLDSLSGEHENREFQKKRLKVSSNLRISQDETFTELFRTWRSMQQLNAKKKENKQMEAATIPELITGFIKKTSLESLKDFIQKRQQRAQKRIQCFKWGTDLMLNQKLVSIKQDVVTILGGVIRSLKDTDSAAHYLTNIRSCGFPIEAEAKDTFLELYYVLIKLLKENETDLMLRKLITDALCVGWASQDHEFLLKIFPTLHTIMLNPDSDTKLLTSATLAFKALTIHCVANVREKSESNAPIVSHHTQLDPLQKFVLDTIFLDIEQTTERLKVKKERATSVTPEDSKLTFDYHKDEKFLYSMLFLFHISTQTIAAESTLATKRTIKQLLSIFHVGTPRLKSLALRMLRRPLTMVAPAQLSDWNLIADFTQGASTLCEYFLHLLGKLLSINDLDHVVPAPHPQHFQSGQVALNMASDIISLFRFLLADPQWSHEVVTLLSATIIKVPTLVSVDARSKITLAPNVTSNHLEAAHAALSIIGGDNTSVMKIGGRVMIKSTKEIGTLVYYDRMSSTSKLILDNNPTKVIACDADKLQALPEITFDPSKFPLTPEIIPTFLVFVKAASEQSQLEQAEEQKAKAEKKEQEQKVVPPSKPGPSAWDCSECTLHNPPTATTCGVCGSRRPDLGAQPTSNAAAPWNCSVCTLQNPAIARECTVCGSPKPVDESPATTPEDKMEEEEKPSTPAPTEQPEDEVDSHQLLCQQLRSRAIKALAALLQCNPSAEVFFQQGGLASLLAMSVTPTKLDEFRSIEQLEAREDRLWELLFQYKHSITDESRQKKVSQLETLQHSPFCKLPVILPSLLDRGSAKRVVFTSSDMRTVTRVKPQMDFPSGMYEDSGIIGLVRANCVIPNSLPAYYFEIKLQKEENSMDVEGGVKIAVGLYREGTELEGLPGNSNSFAYQGDGQLCHNVGSLRVSRIVSKDFGQPFGVGDVIGCGWNIRTNELFFTKNGQFLGDGFQHVVGRFYPVVWVGADVKVAVNFGNEPFVFDFNKTLPEGYLTQLSEAEKTTVAMSSAELRRRTQAEELFIMMDIFPLELCIVALERCKDDINYAAQWLLENGFKELERMSEEIILKTERENREREERQQIAMILQEQQQLGQFTSFEDTALASQLNQSQSSPTKMSSSSRSINNSNGTTTSLNLDEEEDEDQDNDADDYDYDSRESARFLDDEIGAEAPVQVERERRELQQQQHMAVVINREDIKIEDVFLGMLLSVQEDETPSQVIKTVGRTGVVTDVDLNDMRVKLKFFDSDTASIHSLWFPFHSLHKPLSMWQDPCADLKGDDIKLLKKALSQDEAALTVLKVRRTVLSLISDWPSFPFTELSRKDPQSIIDLLKLAASEFLTTSTGSDVGKNKKNPILDSFYAKLGHLLFEENGLNIVPPLKYSQEEGITNSSSTETTSLTPTLTSECIKHFRSAVEAPPPVIIEESAHPYENNQDIRKRLHIQGASKLIIRFDPQCNVHRSDLMTRCSFYRDSEYQDLIVTYKGSSSQQQQFQPIIVDGNTVYFRFTSGVGETFWGYKMTISPLNLRYNDVQALQGLNFELGYWLLELLLEKGPDMVKKVYIKDLYEALLYYISASKRSAKARGIQLLLKVLQQIQIQKSPVTNISLEPIMAIQAAMERRYYREIQETNLLHSAHLQSMVELLAIATLTHRAMLPSQDIHSLANSSLDIIQFRSKKLQILKATYGSGKGSSDVTAELQKLVDSRFGGSYLLLPATHTLLPFLKEVASNQDRKLSISYQVVDSAGTVLIKTKKTVSNGEQLIINSDSWFEDILLVSETIQNITRSNSFSTKLLIEALSLEKIRRDYFWPLLMGEHSVQPDTGVGVADPGPYTAFTVSLFVNLAQDSTGKVRTIFVKGHDGQYNRNPGLLLNPNERTVLFQVTTTKNWCESYQSQTQIPLNTWTHVACWCDGKVIKLFIDGKLDGEKKLKGRMITNSCPIYLNKLPHGVQQSDAVCDGFQGSIQDAVMFMRPLNEDEIIKIYKSRKEGHPKPPLITTKDVESLMKQNQQWNLAMDEQLVEMLSKYCDYMDRGLFDLPSEFPSPPPELLRRYYLISSVPVSQLQFRFNLIRLFNIKLATVFPLIDFSQSHLTWSLGHSLTNVKGLIFLQTKLTLWNKILSNTHASRGRPSVRINRPKALKAKERGDPEGSRSVFGQMYRQLHFLPPSSLRRTGQIWTVEYLGEGGTDAGGLFRDCVSHACTDLQSPYVPLFVPVPNSRGFGDNQEKFVPNPASTSSLQLSMFAFVGKLMGIAIRAKHILNLDLPSIVWKQLVGSDITRHDLEAIDALSYKLFDQLSELEKQDQIDPEAFEDLVESLTFTTRSTDGREVELVEGGKNKKVTFDNRMQYLKLVEQYRLSEFTPQVDAIRSGLATIVPIQLLSLFTWQELELSVCGKREVSIELLKDNTSYSGWTKEDQQVKWLWQALENFTPEERQMFLRFVWGRSRLPLSSEDFEQKFVVMTCPRNTDQTLPISHTCFFQLELPRYTNYEVLRKKILYAITECRAIDADHAAQNVNWEEDDD